MEKTFSKVKRNLGRALNMSGEGTTRDRVDNDETAENMEFMVSRGQSKKDSDYNRATSREGLKIRKSPLRDVQMRTSRR